jgi:ribonuclease Z
MKPLFHPHLVNDPFADPALYIEFLFEKRALMFDLGDIPSLATRKILRLTHIFVSHTHMDHFIGFDRILRICLGRAKILHIIGPPKFIDHVEHKLGGYTWNLVENYDTDFTIIAGEYSPSGILKTAQFRCRQQFKREEGESVTIGNGVLLEEENFLVRAVHLDHKIPCLAFTLEEKWHVNVWKNRLDELDLPTGPWLKELKTAVLRDMPDETSVRIWWRDGAKTRERYLPLGELKKEVLNIVPGQKIAYVVDTIYNEQNAPRIIKLAQDADIFFIEAAFLHSEAERAAHTYHLTAHQAGLLARAAKVKRIVPFHFSARHSDDQQRLMLEAEQAFVDGNAG